AEPGSALNLDLGVDPHIPDELALRLVEDLLFEGEGRIHPLEEERVIEGNDLILPPDLVEEEGAAADADLAVDLGAAVAALQPDLAARGHLDIAPLHRLEVAGKDEEIEGRVGEGLEVQGPADGR